jgi:hypothetical protein
MYDLRIFGPEHAPEDFTGDVTREMSASDARWMTALMKHTLPSAVRDIIRR